MSAISTAFNSLLHPKSSSSSSNPTTVSPSSFPVYHPPLPTPDVHFSKDQLHEFIKTIKQDVDLPKTSLPILSIGGGNIVQVAHYPAYKECGFTVKGITDLNLDTARTTAKDFNIPNIYSSVEEMVTDNKDQKVVYDIAVPAKAIYSILEKLPPNSYALIQKPMGENIQEAQQIRDLCRQKNITAAINFQLRTAPYIIAAKDMITNGIIGEITGIDFRVNVFTPWHKWVFLEKAARMEVIYHSIHYIDLMRDLYGEPKALHAMTYKHIQNPKLHSTRSNLLFVYSPYVQTTIHTNHGHRWGQENAESYVKIEGTKGVIKAKMGVNIDYPRSDLDLLQVATDETNGQWIDIPITGSWFPEAFKGPMANIMKYAEGSIDKIPTSVEDAYNTMAVCEAAYISAEHLTPVKYD